MSGPRPLPGFRPCYRRSGKSGRDAPDRIFEIPAHPRYPAPILLWQDLSWLISRAAYPHRSPAEISLVFLSILISVKQCVVRDYYATRLHAEPIIHLCARGKKMGGPMLFTPLQNTGGLPLQGRSTARPG